MPVILRNQKILSIISYTGMISPQTNMPLVEVLVRHKRDYINLMSKPSTCAHYDILVSNIAGCMQNFRQTAVANFQVYRARSPIPKNEARPH